MCADESIHQLWKQFRWWFLRRHWLRFPQLSLSQQRLCALTNLYVSYGSSFGDYFWGGSDSFSLTIFESTTAVRADESIRQLRKLFRWWFLNRHRLRFPRLFLGQQGLRALMNPCVNSGSCFGDDSWVRSDPVFLDYFWANRACVRSRIDASAQEKISVMISEWATSQFSLTISKSTGAMCANESNRQLCKQFRWWFLNRHRLGFP